MPTVAANNLTVCHKGSNGLAISSAPDVCKTPMPFGPIPLPYPNIAKAGDLSGGSKRTTADGNSIAVKGSKFAKSMGDEAGSAGGLASGVNKGAAKFISSSSNVMIEGKPVCRLSDKMMMNKGNTMCSGVLIAPVVVVLAGSGAAKKNRDQKEDLKIEFLDEQGKPIKGEKFVVHDFFGKKVGSGNLDDEGKATVKDLVDGDDYYVSFPDHKEKDTKKFSV